MNEKGEKFREQDKEGRAMGKMKEEHIQRCRTEPREQNPCKRLDVGPCFSRCY